MTHNSKIWMTEFLPLPFVCILVGPNLSNLFNCHFVFAYSVHFKFLAKLIHVYGRVIPHASTY